MFKRNIKKLLGLFIIYLSYIIPGIAQDNVISYKLPNGLTICLNEDYNSQYITGALVCKVADNLMPKGKEALAHCIEHMLFKGTPDLGTNNWEREKPIYEAIVSQYKKLDKTKDEPSRKKIKKRIAELSDSASKYIIPGEFYLLQADIGNGEGFTYYNDYTIYYNSFLPDKLDKFLDLNGHRLNQPVFREFLKEQRVLSQEYFEKSKDKTVPRWDYIYKAMYGKPTNEELSSEVFNLSLSDVIDMYNKYYVPENMALIISGNFSAERIKSKIDASFSKIPARKSAGPHTPPTPNFTKREVKNAYFDDQRSVTLLFKGAPHLAKDYYPYRVALGMLANGFNGLQDSIWHNRLIDSFRYNWNWGKNGCLTYIYINPFGNQTLQSAKTLVLNQFEKVAKGNFSDQLLVAAKKRLERDIDLEKDNLFQKVSNIAQHFVYDLKIPIKVNDKSLFDAVTREEVMRVAKQYLLDNYVELYPFTEKKKIASQMDIDIHSGYLLQKNYKSAYAYHFDSIPDFNFKISPFSFADVFDTTLVKGVKYFSITNSTSKLFHLKFTYRPSKEVHSALNKIDYDQRFEYLSAINTDNWIFRQNLAQLGCTYSFDHLNNGTIVMNVYGQDEHFNEIMLQVSSLFKTPTVDIKNVLSANNNMFPVSADSLGNIYKQMFGSLYEVSYYGSLQTDKALSVVTGQLDLKEKISPQPQNMVNQYDSNVPEIRLWLYSKASSPKHKMQMLVLKNYIFRILWDEIRVANGLAYLLGTDAKIPESDNTSGFLYASIRTKDYQIPMASEILTGILRNLPENGSIFECAKQQVKKDYLSKVLNPKVAFDYIKDRKSKGLTQNPEINELESLDKLNLSELINFYKEQFGHSNVKIDIYGNINEIGKTNYDRIKKDLELRAFL